MSPPDPKHIAKAMISPQWAGLLRLGLDREAVATWNPTLIRHPRLLVPVDVQALYVPEGSDEAFVRLPFALTTADGTDAEAMPPPFDAGTIRPSGVHLHWALPDALLAGEMRSAVPGSANRLGMAALPDRWTVLRIVVPRHGDAVAVRGWLIEADTTRVIPLESLADGADGFAPTGKRVEAEQLTGSVGGTLNWTAVYDAVLNRFAFHDPLDDLESLAGGGALGNLGAYVVAGWWSDARRDPLDDARSKAGFQDTLDELNWRLAADREGGDVLPGMAVMTAAKQATLGLPTGQRFAKAVPKSGGAAESLLASEAYVHSKSRFAEDAGKVRRASPRHVFSTLLHGVIHGVPLAGRRPGPDQRPRPGDVSVALGLHGDDVDAALATAGMDLADAEERRDTERVLAAFTGQRLDRLGTADGLVDVEEYEHAAGFESRPGGSGATDRVRAGAEAGTLPAGRAARAREAERRAAGRGSKRTADPELVFAPGSRSDLKTMAMAEQRKTVGEWIARQEGPAPEAEARLVQRPAPRYYRPLEPVVAVRNAARSLRHRGDGRTAPDGRLLVRWPTQVATAVEGVVNAESLIRGLPGGGALPGEILMLARSALALDPYRAKWLSRQAENQSGVPRAAAEARLAAEVALRYGGDATYDVAHALGVGAGQGDRRLAGYQVREQLRRFSLVAGVDTDPVGVTAWSQPWVPLWLEWEVELTTTDRLGATRLGALDLDPDGADWLPDAVSRTVAGRSALNTGSAKALASAIDAWIEAETARDVDNQGEADDDTQAALASLADAVETVDVMSATLESFQEALLGLPVGDYGVLSPRSADGTTLAQPEPLDVPTLLVNGGMRLARARLVDAFGRLLELPVGRVRVPERARVEDTSQGTLRLNPRLMRPARWLFRLVDPGNLGEASPEANIDQIDPLAMVNPVAGFLLPDHIDEALEVFDTAGNPLGQIMHEPFGGGVTWEVAPGRDGPADAGPHHGLNTTQQILGFLSAAVIAADAERRGGEVAQPETESALSAMLRAIDTTLWTVDTFAQMGTSHIAGLVGRPIAVVRATLRLDIDDDLDELDLSDAEKRAAREAAYRDLADRAFPVRIGELTRADDGLLGFFVDDDYQHFHVVDKAVRDGALDGGHGRGHLAQKGAVPQVPPVRPIDHPYVVAEDELVVHPGQVLRLTLLMHPGGKVHLTSGILPRKSLQLVREWTHTGLSVIAPSARIGPVLIEPGEVRLPKISSFPKDQIWTRRNTPVTWRDDPILSATQTALLPDMPAEVQEGYIRVGPKAGEDSGGGGA